VEAASNPAILAANLGALFATSSVRTLVIELENRSDTTATRPDESSAGIAAVLAGTATLEASIVPGRMGSADRLPAGHDTNGGVFSEAAHSETFAGMLQHASASYDLILVAMPAFDGSRDMTQVIATIDGMVLLVESGITQASRLSAAVSALQSSGTPVIGAVLTSKDDGRD
jgi:polysaccharide biosynthesis transport protein